MRFHFPNHTRRQIAPLAEGHRNPKSGSALDDSRLASLDKPENKHAADYGGALSFASEVKKTTIFSNGQDFGRTGAVVLVVRRYCPLRSGQQGLVVGPVACSPPYHDDDREFRLSAARHFVPRAL